MKIKASMMAMLIMVIIFGGILVTMAVDIWSTTKSKTPIVYKEGTHVGEYNPEDIRGSYTFDEISTFYNIDLKVLFEAFGIDPNTDGTAIKTKDLETIFGESEVEIGNESVQVFVALYKNLPITLTDTYLPKSAVELIFQANTQLNDEQKTYLDNHQIELNKEDLTSAESDSTALILEQTEAPTLQESTEESLVNGKTTFQQVLDAGVSPAQIQEILGRVMPSSNQTIKDYCTSEGLSFSSIKDQINRIAEK